MHLTPVMEKYVLHWGEMGTRWGVSRSVAQVHALLFLSPAPMTADEICSTLALARSNVSTSLKELISWELVMVTQKIGDRRDHFVAETDPWAAFLKIVKGRKQREIDPTLTTLRQCVEDATDDSAIPEISRKRMKEVLELMELQVAWYDQVHKLPRPTLLKLMKMGAKVVRLIDRIS